MTRGRVWIVCVLTLALAGPISASALGVRDGGAEAGSAASEASGALTLLRGTATSQPSVWITASDGSDARHFAAGESASISPNGDYVAVTTAISTRGGALELFGINGKLESSFFSAKLYDATPLAWTADSRYLVVQLDDTGVAGEGALALIDTSTMKDRVLATGVLYGASFNPAGNEIAYGIANSESQSSPVNLYSVSVISGPPSQLTTNGRSLFPLWVRSGILYDVETLRGNTENPAYQLWLKSGSKLRQLTHMKIPPLQGGLVPHGASADGNHILAEFGGEDTDYAWTVQLSPLRVKEVDVDGRQVQGAAISRNGRQLLIDTGAFEQPADDGTVESIPFNGGQPTRLAQGAQPSWNR